ncbi:sigma-70 family RNA polymerase sigma factor [Glycomyces sp. NPDC021274]|uniref:sigma-70 family RNA polymerase sigma factor n=1 Tax=Glycomyces sp. NPDC021274 TaxID=3155120 RepID=UPI0033D9BC99
MTAKPRQTDHVSGMPRDLAHAELESQDREADLLPERRAIPEEFPALRSVSIGFMYRMTARALHPEAPEYVVLPMESSTAQFQFEVGKWNMLWEAAQFRGRFFARDELPEAVAKVQDLGDVNAIFVPHTRSRYSEYAPLFHLLPKAVLQRAGLPLLHQGVWPIAPYMSDVDRYLPVDFERRLASAWAWTVWPHLVSGSRLSAFTGNDPIKLLAHNLDFWVPPVTPSILEALSEHPESDPTVGVKPVFLDDGTVLEDAVAVSPRVGGSVWLGEEEAKLMVAATVQAADKTGRLRSIIDAVRSNRVEDDFSAKWSYAREDFERKLYHKRSRVQVRFVELTDTVPVQGPGSDLSGHVVTSDFLALLDEKQRQVIVMLSSGFRQHEIAELLGYANHSPISKRLEQIRELAARYFG